MERQTIQSRVTYVRLMSLQLRLANLWCDAAGGHQEALVQMAVGVINGERVIRSVSNPGLRSLAHPVPANALGKCNLSSIASATGLNRETVRRVVNRLIAAGPLARTDDGSIGFLTGWTQGPETHRLGQGQLEEICRTVNLLLGDGVLSTGEGSLKLKPAHGHNDL